MMKRIEADLAVLAQVEQFPKMEGRQMIMVLAPRSKKG
jgi:translation initiation factor IF-3